MKHTPESILISDQGSGACVEIVPGHGFTCRTFRVPLEGEIVDILWGPEEGHTEQGQCVPLYGIPILFPFPGRIRDGRFSFAQKGYQLQPGDGLGNAIHGFVLDRPWKVVDANPDRVVGLFDASDNDPGILDSWPADFRLTSIYRIIGTTLHGEFIVENKDPKSVLPFGFGLHPYFRIPPGKGTASNCRVVVPAEDLWELDERLLPTGRCLPVSGMYDLRRGRFFPEIELDHVFGGLGFLDRCCTISVEEGRGAYRIWMTFPDLFQYCIVYTPSHRQAICVEPYTCIPDPFTLKAKCFDTGLRVLSPGQTFRTWIRIGVK